MGVSGVSLDRRLEGVTLKRGFTKSIWNRGSTGQSGSGLRTTIFHLFAIARECLSGST